MGERKEKKRLTAEEEEVITRGGTEAPFTGKYNKHSEKGEYLCRRCGAALFRSSDKFDSGSGWPSFDDEIPGAVKRVPDGTRTEIRCSSCGAHLGHVFTGEKLTGKDTRHCVNSVSLDFVPEGRIHKAVFAGGCFWGLEHKLRKAEGVLNACSGFAGGAGAKPTSEEVRAGRTGHYEAVEIEFDSSVTGYEELARLFFRLHDFTKEDGQGPDTGPQYRPAVFFNSDEQEKTARKIIGELAGRGFTVATKVLPLEKFYPAGEEHQRYYQKKGISAC